MARYHTTTWIAAGLVLASASAGRAADGRNSPKTHALGWVDRLPVVAEHRYTMTGRIRPLLFFWISKDGVGGGRIVWRRHADGGVAFELLIGSDPLRAPRRVNKWGYVAEAVHGPEAELIGVMTESSEQSLDEAKARLGDQAGGGIHVFKAIRSSVAANDAAVGVATVGLNRDLSYRDVSELLDVVVRETRDLELRHARLPGNTQPGFLAAVAELVHRSVDARRPGSEGSRSARQSDAIAYLYNGKLYDLKLRGSEVVPTLQIGSRRYGKLLRAQFAIRNRATNEETRFELTYGTEGALAEIPVRIIYRPRWWFEAELTLNDDVEF